MLERRITRAHGRFSAFEADLLAAGGSAELIAATLQKIEERVRQEQIQLTEEDPLRQLQLATSNAALSEDEHLLAEKARVTMESLREAWIKYKDPRFETRLYEDSPDGQPEYFVEIPVVDTKSANERSVTSSDEYVERILNGIGALHQQPLEHLRTFPRIDLEKDYKRIPRGPLFLLLGGHSTALHIPTSITGVDLDVKVRPGLMHRYTYVSASLSYQAYQRVVGIPPG